MEEIVRLVMFLWLGTYAYRIREAVES